MFTIRQRSNSTEKFLAHNGAHLLSLCRVRLVPLRGPFFIQSFFYIAQALPAKEDNLSRFRQRSSMASVTRSTERNIRGCRNKNRPNGTSSLADHGLVFGGAVRLAPGKQMLPGKSWMAPVMVWPLQPVGAFAHKASLKELELMCQETGLDKVALNVWATVGTTNYVDSAHTP